MSLERRIGLGFTLGVDSTGGTSFTTIASIVDGIEGPGADSEVADVSILTDTFKRKRKAMVDAGKVTYTIAYDPNDTNSQLLGLLLADVTTVANWRVGFPDQGASTSQAETFTGLLVGMNRKAKRKELVVADITIDVDGNPGFRTS
jgi:hypothetical protein